MTSVDTDDRPGVAEWLAVVLLCGGAFLSALLELLFLGQFYVGTFLVPVVVVAAVVGNVVLPLWGSRIVHAVGGAVWPVLAWLVPILVLTMYTRPEGDLFVIAEYQQQWVFYALLLLGAGAGFATVVSVSGRGTRLRRPGPPAARTAPRPAPRAASGARPAPGSRPVPGTRPAPGARPARKK